MIDYEWQNFIDLFFYLRIEENLILDNIFLVNRVLVARHWFSFYLFQ